ncbi:Biotinylated protein TB7.3 [bioreactor metagenome]|uniref:Biotinylated protein TB7.3 n=2 Tax=root TaxID=1 RepID=A0A644YXW7_9ZZZZ
MQGTVVKVAVADGQEVHEGDLVVVLEAMKMEQPINAHRTGIVTGLAVAGGQSVQSGEVMCEIIDAE